MMSYYLGRQTTIDMYEMRLKTQRKSVNFIVHSDGELIYFFFQTLFHYDGVYSPRIHKCLF